jgi:hypothetical protein
VPNRNRCPYNNKALCPPENSLAETGQRNEMWANIFENIQSGYIIAMLTNPDKV